MTVHWTAENGLQDHFIATFGKKYMDMCACSQTFKLQILKKRSK